MWSSSEDERNALKENIQQLCLDLVSPDQETSGQQWQDHDSESNNISQQSSEDAVQPAKKPRLMHFKASPSQSVKLTKTATTELFEYLNCNVVDEVLPFWKRRKYDLPKLTAVAARILAVPASSSPIERVFSSAGYIMRPHRARLSFRTLGALVFLKVNKSLLASL